MSSDTQFTCPMHPEIMENEFGECPLCGMALEPMSPSFDDDKPNPELIDFTRRFWVGLIFTVPVMVLAMAPHIGIPLESVVSTNQSNWIQLILTTPVMLWCGWPFLTRGWTSVKNKSLNMFSLIALGTTTAYIFSILATAIPQLFAINLGVYFEVSCAIVILVLLGQIIELKGRAKTGNAIRKLLELAPKTATLIDESGQATTVDVSKLDTDDLIRVHPGERIPLDGIVQSGKSSVDESLLTGESVPVHKIAGDTVYAGTINSSGSFIMRVKSRQSETRLAQIARTVANAQRSRPPIQNTADNVAAWFVQIVLAIAIISFIAWVLIGPMPSVNYAFTVFVAVLIIACPCALGLAAPMSVMVGIGRAVDQGILVRDAQTMENLANFDTLIVDKTGTITEGKPNVTEIHATSSQADQALAYAVALAHVSEHPLANAIAAEGNRQQVPILNVENFESVSGMGVAGTIENTTVILGNEQHLESHGITVRISDLGENYSPAAESALVYLAVNGQLSAVFEIADSIKKTSKTAISNLQNMGITIVMLSGDREVAAKSIATSCGIANWHARFTPEQKQDYIRTLQQRHCVVAMAGDGINDAPALAQANVGIAMEQGADVALESAGVLVMNGDLLGIVRARSIAHATLHNIRQNLFFAFVYNLFGVAIAAGALYPFLGILLSPVVAAAAMSLSSISVIGNALRMRRYPTPV